MLYDDLKIDWDRVRGSLLEKEKIGPGSARAISAGASALLDRARTLATARAAAVEVPVLSAGNDSITVAGDIELGCGKISPYLKNAGSLYIFLATIGPSIENEASTLMGSGDGLSGYLLDRIGSLTVESLADALEGRVRTDEERQGRSVSKRFSPGYCDWPLGEQVKLDKVLDFQIIGVHLTESCMMVPKKSISGVMGIGPKGLFSKGGSQCGICDMKDCAWRRA